jgi:hypothetical protein
MWMSSSFLSAAICALSKRTQNDPARMGIFPVSLLILGDGPEQDGKPN